MHSATDAYKTGLYPSTFDSKFRGSTTPTRCRIHKKAGPLAADHLALPDLDMLEALDILNPILGWSDLYSHKELAVMCDMMLERLQCEFAQRVNAHRSSGVKQASSAAWTFDCFHIWSLLSKRY